MKVKSNKEIDKILLQKGIDVLRTPENIKKYVNFLILPIIDYMDSDDIHEKKYAILDCVTFMLNEIKNEMLEDYKKREKI